MKLNILIAGLLITANTMAQFSSHRQLFILNNQLNAHLAQQQLDLLNKAAAGVKERVIKITVAEKGSLLFKKYGADPDEFTVILIGKDGFEKYRTNKVLSTDQLFSIIDAMPMRRQEMKNSKSDKN